MDSDSSVGAMKREKPYKDEDTLRSLYQEQKLSSKGVAERLGCAPNTVLKWLRKHDIEVRSRSESISYSHGYHPNEVPIVMHRRGQVRWNYCYKNKKHSVYVHRLLAVAEYGFEEVADSTVHHKNDIPWDNRPENIELMDHGEHTAHHSQKVDWLDSLRMAEMYRSGASSYTIAEQFDVAPETVRRNIDDMVKIRGPGGSTSK